MLFKSFLALVLLCLQLSVSFAQQHNISQHVEKLHNYSRNRPEEKVYLHFDKNYYVAGETLWFKGYITLGADHFPSTQSELLYVDFYDQKDQLVDQIRVRCKNGFGNGHFEVPDNLKGTQLRVRAYTHWMRNFNTGFSFQKSLPLISEEENISSSSEISVNFYPEGGEMITGILNKIAIKTNLNPGDEYFLLVDGDNEEIKEVEIDERGYGQFTLKPQDDQRYFINFKGQKFELPAPMHEGISMTLNSYSYPDYARLTLRKKPGSSPNKVSIMVHTRGTVHYTDEVDFSRAAAITNIPKGILPSGVNHLTLFDETGKPLAERLFYIDGEDVVSLNIKTPKETISTRKKVTLNLDLSDIASTNTLESNLSLTATQRTDIETNPYTENIKTYLLLNSDLRGQIENPGYYFSDDSKEKRQALDLVMMTHGWRRFTWKKVLSNQLDSVQYEPEKGMTIRGRMVNKGNRKPVVAGTVTYLNKQQGQLTMRSQLTDENGEFELNDLLHTEEDEVVLKGIISGKGLKRVSKQFVNFEMDTTIKTLSSSWLVNYGTNLGQDVDINGQIIADTDKRNLYDSLYNFDPDVRIIEGVTVEEERQYDQGEVSAIYGKGTDTFEVPDTPTAHGARDIFTLLAGQVSGVSIKPTFNPANTIVQIRGAARIGSNAGVIAPKYVLNDMETDLTTLVYIPIEEIDRVEIFKGPDALAHGLNTIGGVIAVYTKSGFDADITVKKEEGLYNMTLPGLHAFREFFGPDYATSIPEHAKPDTRSLIHWQPAILTDSTGHATVEFWTSDKEGIIDINIQGLTYGGKPIVKTTSVQVKED